MIFTFKFSISRYVDEFNREHQTPEYKIINAALTIPTLVDGQVNVFEANAIAIYLVEKYGNDDSLESLYPKNLEKRTKINEILFYNSMYLFSRVYQTFMAGYKGIETEIPKSRVDEFLRAYSTIELLLTGTLYLVGNTVTLADLSLWAQIESLSQLIKIDGKKFPKFIVWLERMRTLPTTEINRQGAIDHVAYYRKSVQKTLAIKQNKKKLTEDEKGKNE